jgi:hypothetical protein
MGILLALFHDEFVSAVDNVEMDAAAGVKNNNVKKQLNETTNTFNIFDSCEKTS